MHLHQAVKGPVDLLAVLTCDEGYYTTPIMTRTFTLKIFLIEKSAEGTYSEVKQIKKDPVTVEVNRNSNGSEFNKSWYQLEHLEQWCELKLLNNKRVLGWQVSDTQLGTIDCEACCQARQIPDPVVYEIFAKMSLIFDQNIFHINFFPYFFFFHTIFETFFL